MRWLFNILDAIYDGVMVVDEQGSIVYANPAYTRTFGVSVHKVLNRKLRGIEPDSRVVDVGFFLVPVDGQRSIGYYTHLVSQLEITHHVHRHLCIYIGPTGSDHARLNIPGRTAAEPPVDSQTTVLRKVRRYRQVRCLSAPFWCRKAPERRVPVTGRYRDMGALAGTTMSRPLV